MGTEKDRGGERSNGGEAVPKTAGDAPASGEAGAKRPDPSLAGPPKSAGSPVQGFKSGSSSRPPRPDGPAARTAPKWVKKEGYKRPGEKLQSIEEISGSLLLDDDESDGAGAGVEELSGSLLLDDSAGSSDAPVVSRPLGSQEPLPSPSNPTPKRKLSTLLGMPQLPKATPPPKLGEPPLEPDQLPTRLAWPSPFAGPPQGAPPGERVDPSTAGPVASPPEEVAGSLRSQSEPVKFESEAPTLPRAAFIKRLAELGRGLRRLQGRLAALGRGLPQFLGRLAGLGRGLPRFLGRLAGLGRGLRRLQAALLVQREKIGVRRFWLGAAAGAAGLVVGVGLVVLIVSGNTDKKSAASETPATPSGTALPGPSETPSLTASASAPAPPPAPACVIAGPPHVVAPNAVIAAGVEVRALGDEIAVGFAPSERQASGVSLDPVSLSPTRTATARSAEPVRRVTPLDGAKGSLTLAVDVDRKVDAVQERRTLPLERPLQLGVSKGSLVWARRSGAAAGNLWPLGGDSAADALRASSEGTGSDTTTVIALRRGGAVGFGTATGSASLAPKGDLSNVAGLGPNVGSPAIALSSGVALAAWADRPSPDDVWRLRWVRFGAGEAPKEPATFVPPAGGKGEQAMSPAIAAAGGKRFLLVWTEGPMSRHDVRALTLSDTGSPIGGPLDISTAGVNAGQGQAAVTSAGRGLIAFLESTDAGFEVVATPVSCP